MTIDTIMEVIKMAVLILSMVVSIIGFIVVSVKTGKLDLDKFKAFIAEILPIVISEVENTTTGAENKKALAISLTSQALTDKYGAIPKNTMSKLTRYIATSIENVLSTPQKKEV